MRRRSQTRHARIWAGRLTAAGLGLAAIGIAADCAAKAGEPADNQHTPSSRGTGIRNGAPLLFSADDLNYDNRLNVVIAKGNVQVSQNGRTVLADAISYNENTDTVVASGHVTLIEPGGDEIFATYVALSNDLRDGFVKDVRILLADRSRFAANTGRRVNGDWSELRRGVYSPCDVCQKDPAHPPIWQLKAERIIDTRTNKTIEFQNAWMEIDGVPVFYTPYLSYPDPSVKRQSGFLVPSIETSNQLGVHTTIPYFWAIAPDKDLLFSPILSTKTGIVLAGRYRQRFDNGYISTFASVTDAFNGYGSPGPQSGPNQIRGNIDSTGVFDLSDQFRTGFSINRATDQTYTRVYNLSTWNNFLLSDAYLEDFDGRNYGSITGYSFQALRQGISDRTQPYVLPAASYTWYGRPLPWGGQFTTTADMLDVLRQTGPSAQRFSLGTRYDQPFVSSDGEVMKAMVALRGDSYYISNAPGIFGNHPFTGATGRVFPQLGFEWRFPFIRHQGKSSWLVEPKAAIYAAPPGGNSENIVNNDSQAFNFSDADLFVPDRLYGLDEVDGGQRVDYAIHAAWYGSAGNHGDGLFGQSYRFQHSTAFQPGTGLDSRRSDYVGRLTYSPGGYLDLGYHFRLARQGLAIRNQQLSASFGPQWLRMTLTYISLTGDPRDAQPSLRQIGGSISYKLNSYWTFDLSTVRNIGNDIQGSGVEPGVTPYYAIFNNPLNAVTLNSSLANRIGISYTDECLAFVASFVQTGTSDRDLKPDNAILFQLVFKNLGVLGLPSDHL